ncbi:ZIP family metal transporter [Halogeometricum borinquense]|uniref:ZIP family metal transporter n=1 Tax=Halogeometricum borinquense TaxID=60847 RepID=A0A6C0UE83_9EURY|nr:ZIP family metal transporter [Halogeometricum borinquense]QIB73726.1 ZIP family metal transporter [Halogeometricum borinquense]QIQ76917.1 ZIP family metal transporter [Halogeometricum borinquense]
MALDNFAFVFVAGFITALATGIGAIPFFFVQDISDRWNVVLWGLASGIMLSASVFGLVLEALGEYISVSLAGISVSPIPTRTFLLLGGGLIAGIVLVVVAHDVIDGAEVHPKRYEEADFRKLLLILGILTIHSFPEGVAIGVAFADLGLEGGLQLFGVVVPLLAVFMTIAISIHNIPEGVAISIPLRSMGVPNWRLVWWSVFSSLPQPIGAVIAFYFVRLAREFLPVGFGFAAGAMIFLVLTEFIPEALERGAELPRGGRRELCAGIACGVLAMVPLLFV